MSFLSFNIKAKREANPALRRSLRMKADCPQTWASPSSHVFLSSPLTSGHFSSFWGVAIAPHQTIAHLTLNLPPATTPGHMGLEKDQNFPLVPGRAPGGSQSLSLWKGRQGAMPLPPGSVLLLFRQSCTPTGRHQAWEG